jgi:hypothetical protein
MLFACVHRYTHVQRGQKPVLPDIAHDRISRRQDRAHRQTACGWVVCSTGRVVCLTGRVVSSTGRVALSDTYSAHPSVDRSYPRVVRGLSRLPEKKLAKVIARTGFCVPGHFHGATERFDWFIVSQYDDSPIDLLITSRTDNFPLFVQPRNESYRYWYGFDTPKEIAKVQRLTRLCQDSVQSQD